MKKTTAISKSEKEWYLVDANGVRLGRLATTIARILIGKNKAEYSPHIDCGDNIIVINSRNLSVHPKKIDNKIYWRHSGYPGGIKQRTLGEMMKRNPNQVIEIAVKGMLPRNKLARQIIKKLYVYPDEKHSHEAQKPKIIEISKNGSKEQN
ncbi:MAG: 50S ribosomal protein L13 [Patescibacteria group bacterium]|nr:50S ribosomal protein L13 [Patescibacteria group bacterium]